MFFKKSLAGRERCPLDEQVAATSNALTHLLVTTYPRMGGEIVKLVNDTVALYFPPNATDDSNNAFLSWFIGVHEYEIIMCNETKEAMVAAANLAIVNAQ